MALILFDTNIFIDMLNGVHEATVELSTYDHPAISTITYMEQRTGQAVRPQEAAILDAVLDEFTVLPLDPQVTELAIKIRGASLVNGPKIKLPDAIIAATAVAYNIPIVTRNPRDFAWPGIRVHVPYDYDSATGHVMNVRPPFSNFKPGPTLPRQRRDEPDDHLILTELNLRTVIDHVDDEDQPLHVLSFGSVREICPKCRTQNLKLVLRQRTVRIAHLFCAECDSCFDAHYPNGMAALTI